MKSQRSSFDFRVIGQLHSEDNAGTFYQTGQLCGTGMKFSSSSPTNIAFGSLPMLRQTLTRVQLQKMSLEPWVHK